ncbi:MAG: TraB/GumN family protein, partial [Muribaculaceae bacterium]|nr:TraB/GumN family protein [Muribaculaceae bacterium]
LDPALGFDPQSQARLVDNRNKAWVNTITDIIADKSTIVCVGALHLPGDNGLINLLRGQGYTVTPITKP